MVQWTLEHPILTFILVCVAISGITECVQAIAGALTKRGGKKQ